LYRVRALRSSKWFGIGVGGRCGGMLCPYDQRIDVSDDWRYPGIRPAQEEDPCRECHECALRCTSGVQMTEQEFQAIVAHLRTLDYEQARRVLEQEKQAPWFEEIMREACLFYDVTRRGCLVYPARPLVCRLFGRVEWLPCPIEKPLPKIRRGVELMRLYAAERRATFAEWCMAHDIYDLCRLIATAP